MYLSIYLFQYWESLREKLEKLEVTSDSCLEGETADASSSESTEERERSLTGSSDTPSERVVSGQSSSQGSDSDGSASERMPHSPGSMVVDGTMLSPCDGSGAENVAKGRKTPQGSCLEEILVEGECSRATELPGTSKQDTEDKACKLDEDKVSEPEQDKRSELVMPGQDHDMQENTSATPVCTNLEFYKAFTNDVEIVELDEQAEDKRGDAHGTEKEEGDGSSSPPPAPCQPSKKLAVIVEELEQCVLPE